MPPAVSAFAFTGEREPTVRPVSADKIAITARSSMREYPHSAGCNRGEVGLAMLKEMGAKTIVGFPWKMQEKFRVYRFCLKRYLLVIFASPKLALGRFCLDRRPATSGIARTPFSPNVESEGSQARPPNTSCPVANLSYNAVQVISDIRIADCSSYEMK